MNTFERTRLLSERKVLYRSRSQHISLKIVSCFLAIFSILGCLALAFLLNNSKRKLDNNERLFTALFSTKQTPLGSSPILSRESKVPVKERNIPANDSDSFVANAAI